MLIDTHCHIHDKQFYPEDREGVYVRSADAGVQMIVVGTSEEDSREAVRFADAHDGVWAVVGVHPHDAKEGCDAVGQLLAERPAKESKIIGVGEIGLDYYYDNSPRDVQIKVFEQQLQWAQDYGLPVSFHVRSAFDDFWSVLDNFTGIRGVLHSFTDTMATLDQALMRGLYVGVNGISTFTKDPHQQEVFRRLPLERMLLETDAPFLTPTPLRGKVNEPAFVRLVAEHHAELRQCSPGDVARVTTANARELFAI